MKHENFKVLGARDYHILIGVIISLIAVIIFMGINNVNTTNAAKFYEMKYLEQKAKADVLNDELTDIKESGTCLPRIPAFEV